jgi:hypothetical protein
MGPSRFTKTLSINLEPLWGYAQDQPEPTSEEVEVTFEDAQLDIELKSRSQAPIRVKEWRRKRGPNEHTDPPWLRSFASKVIRTAMSSLPELQKLVIISQVSRLSDFRKRALRGRCPRIEIALLLETISSM